MTTSVTAEAYWSCPAKQPGQGIIEVQYTSKDQTLPSSPMVIPMT